MSSSLVVCADDFALNPGVSRGIAELAQQARISATSAMVCSPHWPEHARWLSGCRDTLGVGLHLDLTSPWAVKEGHGRGLAAVMAHSLLRLTPSARAEQVIQAQLDRFEQVWQAPPDHIDGHQHVQQFPVWREALVRVIVRRYPHGPRPWLRVSRPMGHQRGFKAWLIGAMGATALRKLALQAQIPCSTHLVGISDFMGDDRRWLQQAATWLGAAAGADGVVLMCHPGRADSDASDGIAGARGHEWSALSGREWPALLLRHGLTLARAPQPPDAPLPRGQQP